MIQNDFYNIGEYAAAGAFEAPERSLFYRKALGLRRYYEHCRLPEYDGRPLYPSGARVRDMRVAPDYMFGLGVNVSGADDKVRALLNRYGADFGQYHSVVPAEHTVAGNMSCHSIPHYGRIVREGFPENGRSGAAGRTDRIGRWHSGVRRAVRRLFGKRMRRSRAD
mgnify:CR=1 FL=1